MKSAPPLLPRILFVVAGAVAAQGLIVGLFAWLAPAVGAVPPPSRTRVVTTRLVRDPLPPPPPPTRRRVAKTASPTAFAAAALPETRSPDLPGVPLPAVPATLVGLEPLALGAVAWDPTGVELPVVPAVRYTPPVLLQPIDPARFYPPSLRRRGIGGVSRLWVRVRVDGTAVVERIIASPPGFADALHDLVAELRYLPARRGDAAVEAVRTLSVQWKVSR